MRFLHTALLVAAKDLKSEIRSRQNLATILFFALVVLVIFHFSLGLADLQFRTVGPGLIWVAIAFAALLGLQSSFVREGERQGLSGLLLSAADASGIYAGKALAAWLTLLAAEAVFLPAAAILFRADLRHAAWPLAVVLALHSAGLAIIGTLFAAMALKVRRGHLLLPVLHFTVTIPLLMSAVKATAGVLEEGSLAGAGIWLRMGLVYDIVFFVIAAMLFEPLIQD
ncbi:MAG: heme exporter protein CcmB [Acidobacteriota bacterium]